MRKSGQKAISARNARNYHPDFNFGLTVPAYKRYRLSPYSLPAQDRFTLDLCRSRRKQQQLSGLFQVTLNPKKKPWWMSYGQYQSMLLRWGVPY